MPSSPIGAAQDDESAPPAGRFVAGSRRRALIVGALTVAAIWIVASREGFDGAQTPAIPGRTRTEATFTIGPEEPPGLVYLPPEGAVPSAQEQSELVANFELINYGWASAFADGRVIWSLDGGRGIHEQRLSPVGVDLVRSGAVSLRKFPTQCWDSCVSPLPRGAWEDAEIRAWIPSRYAICYEGRHGSIEPSRVIGLLPGAAPDLLVGKGRTFYLEGLADPPVECSELITGKARVVLGEILGDAGFGASGGSFTLVLPRKVADSIGDEVGISFLPILPDGALVPRISFFPILPAGR